MRRGKVLALILAGGKGSRLEVLTEKRAKPAMPFAGVYRLIDFALSNCMHSGISDVWVVEQYQAHSLNEHLANGRPWDLDRTYGGLQVLPPYESNEDEGGFADGNADAIYRHRNFIREFAPDTLLVLSADHVYKLDYSDVIEQHLERKADLTIVTTEVRREEASRFGVVQVNADGRVTDFAYKPEQPQNNTVTTEVFVYNAPKLLKTLDELTAVNEKNAKTNDKKSKNKKQAAKADDEETSLKDFGNELLPHLVHEGRAFEYRLKGYWRDVGTVESYWKSHMDLLAEEPALELDDPRWPILSLGTQLLPARIHESAEITNSLISSGCTIRGHVERSVLAPDVLVEQGAIVRDSILFHGTIVRSGATVDQAILDTNVQVGEGATVGAQAQRDNKDDTERDLNAEITLVGQDVHIPSKKRIPAGGRIKPDTKAEALKAKATG